VLHLKLFVRGNFHPAVGMPPVFENLGLKVIAEDAFALTPSPRRERPKQSRCKTS